MITLPTIESLHHSNLVIGTSASVADIRSYFSDNGINTSGNANFVEQVMETFTIDNARKLKELQSHKSGDAPQIFLITTRRITREAQNALLKVLEEPAPNTYFFLIIPDDVTILETLQSRMDTIRTKTSTDSVIDLTTFLRQSPSERLATIQQLTDVKAGSDKMTKPQAIQFLNALEEALADDPERKTDFELFQEIRQARSYLHDQGSSIKMLLEHISLLV